MIFPDEPKRADVRGQSARDAQNQLGVDGSNSAEQGQNKGSAQQDQCAPESQVENLIFLLKIDLFFGISNYFRNVWI